MDAPDRWRYQCPRGHVGWECTGHGFWCSQCYTRQAVETASFERVRDCKTGEWITAADLQSRRAF